MARHRRGELGHAQAIDALDSTDVATALAGRGIPLGEAVCRGTGISQGVVTGSLVLTSEDAIRLRAASGYPVLFLRESRPEDLPGLLASAALVTERGGLTSHAAVVARGLGLVAVTAIDAVIDSSAQAVRPLTGAALRVGDTVTVDAATGWVHRGSMAAPSADSACDVRAWLIELLRDASPAAVRVNADSPADAAHGLAAGASGIGLCRVEHAFLGERQQLLSRALMSVPGPDRLESVSMIGEILRDDLIELLRVMDGYPVTVRLLDPPRHEFLPDLVDSALQISGLRDGEQHVAERDQFELARRLSERNPMLGMRGMRLAVAIPELAQAQMRAVIEATVILQRRGYDPHPQLLLPMVMCVEEAQWARVLLDEVLAQPPGPQLQGPLPLGVMIETPRAAVMAASLARHADFLSIGTNDLTGLLWGLSRDDADREVLPMYRQQNLLEWSPFQRFDTVGVGTVIHDLIATARAATPGMVVGVCGEHVTDPAAARFLLGAGADYLSCPAPLVLPTRIAAAKVTRAGL